MLQGRRFTLYFSWNRPAEIELELGVLDNRFPTLWEFRRAIWPLYEWAADLARYRQDISGFLDHVILFDFQHFSQLITEVTGQPVSIMQRVDNKPPARELDETFLQDIDTLIVVSLDHVRTDQRPSDGEIQAIRHFLEREDACLIVCPHHNIGAEDDIKLREVEFKHHGDRLVPPQQLLGGFGISLLRSLGVFVENRYGLNPAAAPDRSPSPLRVEPDVDELGILHGVPTFNLHPHLPHLQVTLPPNGGLTTDGIQVAQDVRILSQQLINPAAESHPFVQSGNRYFNSLVWVPPQGTRAGNIFVCDATLWSSAFSGVKSLETFWTNLAHVNRKL